MPITQADTDFIKFDPSFTNSKQLGKAFMMNKPLQKDLADQLSIERAKRVNFTFTGHGRPKDITIGLLDGPYSNHLDIIHFEYTLDIIGQSEFKN